MKNILASALAVGLAFALPACAGGNQEATAVVSRAPVASTSPTAGPVGEASQNNQPTGGNTLNPNANARLRLAFNGEEATVRMHDNPTSRDFVATLPRTLTFRDYNAIEKISRLDGRLSTESAPEGAAPVAGDFGYYAPWNDLVIYYKDFTYSSGIVILGKFESGVEKFARITGDVTVRIERIE